MYVIFHAIIRKVINIQCITHQCLYFENVLSQGGIEFFYESNNVLINRFNCNSSRNKYDSSAMI